MNIPSSRDRVPVHTSRDVNERIRRKTERNIRLYSTADRETIEERLKELDREWDIERIIETNSSTVMLAGIILGATVNKKFFILPAVIAAFLLQHAVQGWCPPMPLLRRLGFRTAQEIDYERYSLKAFRGDFSGVDSRSIPRKVLEAVEA